MTTRIIHEGRGWSLYVDGTRRLYEESYGVVCAVAGCMRDPLCWPCSEAEEIAQSIREQARPT